MTAIARGSDASDRRHDVALLPALQTRQVMPVALGPPLSEWDSKQRLQTQHAVLLPAATLITPQSMSALPDLPAFPVVAKLQSDQLLHKSDAGGVKVNLQSAAAVQDAIRAMAAAPLIKAANRHVRWVDTDRHGYGVLDITAERAQMDYYVLSARTADATAAWARSYRTRSGTQKVERSYDPV